MTNNVTWQDRMVSRHERNMMNKHRSGVVWFTGLSASGKSTVALHLEKELFERGGRSYVLDGDNVRYGLNANLGFNREDRKENLRRIAEVSKLYVDAGFVLLAAFISPYREDRAYVKEIVGAQDFFEIYVKCPLDVCECRDPKGLYKKARAGIIKNYTGIDAPYEEPLSPDLIIDTVELDVESSVNSILTFLIERKFIIFPQ